MDPTKLAELANARFDHAVCRKTLKEKIEQQMVVAHNGGLFKATPALIAFLHVWDTVDNLVLEDEYQNPIAVLRLKLLEDLKQAHQYAMNAWLNEFEQTKKIRKLNDI